MTGKLTADEARFTAFDTGDGFAFTWRCAESDAWWAVLTDLKRSFSHATSRRYDPETRLWWVPYRCAVRLRCWADSWFTASAQRWLDDGEDDGTGHGEHESDGWATGRCPSPPPPDPLATAYVTLHLQPSAPAPLVSAARRCLLTLTHPDRGGDPAQATAINVAADAILLRLERGA